MRDMFYNYEHNIDRKDYMPPHFQESPKSADGLSNAELVFNAKGDCLGVKAKKESDFDLFFSLEGFIDGSSIYEVLNSATFVLEIFSSKGKFATSLYGEAFDDTSLVVHVPADTLSADIYNLKLTMILNEKNYVLFSQGDSILHII
jgi:hypothetical protein